MGLRNWWQRLRAKDDPARIPEALWSEVLTHYPFVRERSDEELLRLRALCSQFLAEKEFSGAHGLQASHAMALAIAAQACLPVLHLGLHWYDDFRGIVVHPGAMLAPSQWHDEDGVMHEGTEELSGEAMPGGPVTLSWADVTEANADSGYNVVVHEFVHKLDMRDGVADGCPPLTSPALRQRWPAVMQVAFDDFVEALEKAERFGAEPPWLDAYAASAPAEFFAVSCEAYFVNRKRFGQEFPELQTLFDAFFRPSAGSRLNS